MADPLICKPFPPHSQDQSVPGFGGSHDQLQRGFLQNLTTKLTGGNVAQRNCRPVQRLASRVLYSFRQHSSYELVQAAFHPWTGNYVTHRILPYLAMGSGVRKTLLETDMPHAIFQLPLEQASTASCNMTRLLLPALIIPGRTC